MKGQTLTYYILITISIYCLLPGIFPAVLAECDHCEALPSDCQPDHDTPFSGGPPCICTPTYQPQGCVLKPCALVNDDSICDCSQSTGSVQNRQLCRKYRCTGESGDCQSCRNLPPDCTMNSYSNPPANGGPECSCANQMAPGGCTMKPCIEGSLKPDPCVSKPGGVSSVILFGATCPGSFDVSGTSGATGLLKLSGHLVGLTLMIKIVNWLNMVIW